MKWPADAVERRPLAGLIPYARNARTHSTEQVAQIAASIREWGWTSPILVDEADMIIAGHGRVLAAQQMKLDEVPVMVAAGWSEAQKRAYVIADNKLALNAGWDDDLLEIEISELQEAEFDLGLTGLSEKEIKAALRPADAGAGESKLGDDLVHRVIIDCRDEQHQAELLQRLENEGLTCRALIS